MQSSGNKIPCRPTEKEREGFENLRDGNFEEALKAFNSAHEAFPQLHNVEEIKKLLEQERGNFSDSEARKRILGRILKNHSWGIPSDLRSPLKQAANRSQAWFLARTQKVTPSMGSSTLT